jgi:hypothetical protein
VVREERVAVRTGLTPLGTRPLRRPDMHASLQGHRAEKMEKISKTRITCGVSKHPGAVIDAGFPSRGEACSVRALMNRSSSDDAARTRPPGEGHG